MAHSDEQLMQEVGRGDRAALGELFDRHQPALFAFLCRFLGDRATAEDVVQEVFWRVWQRASTFDPAQRFTPWLYVIARHTALNELKKPYRRGTPFPGAAESGCAGADEERALPAAERVPGMEEHVAELHVREQVRFALRQLPPEQRLCIVLREYEGKSHREIAAVLGCTEAHARVLGHRARRALREALKPLLERAESEGLHV